MARGIYQYGTSPRKIEPEYDYRKKEIKKQQNKTKKISQEEIRKKHIALKQEKRKHHKNIALIVSVFFVLLAVSYRNSLITEKFNEIQNKKDELASIEKTNGQLEVSIEGSLNLKNIENTAEEKLGMKKLTNTQKVYVNLDKKDYTESSTKENINDSESNWFTNFINHLFE